MQPRRNMTRSVPAPTRMPNPRWRSASSSIARKTAWKSSAANSGSNLSRCSRRMTRLRSRWWRRDFRRRSARSGKNTRREKQLPTSSVATGGLRTPKPEWQVLAPTGLLTASGRRLNAPTSSTNPYTRQRLRGCTKNWPTSTSHTPTSASR